MGVNRLLHGEWLGFEDHRLLQSKGLCTRKVEHPTNREIDEPHPQGVEGFFASLIPSLDSFFSTGLQDEQHR